MTDDTTFYMVWVEGRPGSVRVHPTRQSADEEAVRLARQEKRPAYILKAITCIEEAEPPIKQTELRDEKQVRIGWESQSSNSV